MIMSILIFNSRKENLNFNIIKTITFQKQINRNHFTIYHWYIKKCSMQKKMIFYGLRYTWWRLLPYKLVLNYLLIRKIASNLLFLLIFLIIKYTFFPKFRQQNWIFFILFITFCMRKKFKKKRILFQLHSILLPKFWK